jgi:excisionase family DNA binding protein
MKMSEKVLTVKDGQPVTTMMTVKEVSKLLQIHPLTTRRLCLEGVIPGFKVGRQWRVHPRILNEWMDTKSTENLEGEKDDGRNGQVSSD